MVESFYRNLVDDGVIPNIKYGSIILYTISCGYVLFNAAIEPQAMPLSYFHFLSGLSGKRIYLFNRPIYNHLGFDSVKYFPTFTADLNPKFVTINQDIYNPIRP